MRPRGGATHTVATLPISAAAYEEISRKLKEANYDHCFMHASDGPGIDMGGIAVVPEPQGEMTHVPVVIGFKSSNVIGSVLLMKDKMPPGAGWVLALGYRLVKGELRPEVEGQKIRGMKVDEIELVEVSLVSDLDYKRYLESDLWKADNP